MFDLFCVFQLVRYYGTLLPVMFVAVLLLALGGQLTAFAKGKGTHSCHRGECMFGLFCTCEDFWRLKFDKLFAFCTFFPFWFFLFFLWRSAYMNEFHSLG